MFFFGQTSLAQILRIDYYFSMRMNRQQAACLRCTNDVWLQTREVDDDSVEQTANIFCHSSFCLLMFSGKLIPTLQDKALRAALNFTRGLKNPADDGFIRGLLQSVGGHKLSKFYSMFACLTA